MSQDAGVLSFSPLYQIIPYKILRWAVTLAGAYIYYTCFRWNIFFALIMVPMFGYLFYNLVGLIIHFFIYLFTEPLILSEAKGYIEKGIPADCKVVFFRPIFANTTGEMDTVLNSMEQDIKNNQEPHKNLKFIVIDNTRKDEVKQYTQEKIRELQGKYGDDVVFYFHRNVKCDFFKKVGIYMDAIMLLAEGWTKPRTYTDPKWDEWTKGTRSTAEPVWDVILGNVRALGIQSPVEDILAGKEIKMDEKDRIKVSFVSDADNVWPKGQIRKLVAKIMHPSNSNITIYQPSIELSNPDENGFIKLTSWARQMYGFDLVAKWRLYHFTPFFGKGAMHVENYVREIIKGEWLHPGRAASHDFQEALKAWSVLVEDVFIMEKTFSNKLAELMRGANWQWGDMETVQHYLARSFEPGRKAHLFVLLGNLIANPVYAAWVFLQACAWTIPGIAETQCPRRLFLLFAAIVLAAVVVPKFGVPLISRYKPRTYPPTSPMICQQNLMKIIAIGLLETLASILIHMLDLVYKTMALVQNIMKQYGGKAFVWKTGAMSELETANATLVQVYAGLYISTIIGAVLLCGAVFRVFPAVVNVFLLPYTASFLLGPLVIWVTSRTKA